MKKIKKIFVGLFIFLLLTVIGIYLYGEYRKSLIASVERSMATSFGVDLDTNLKLGFTLQVFQVVNSRWPNNIDEFKSFSNEYYMNFDFESFQDWSFEETSNSRLKVRFFNKSKNVHEMVEVQPYPKVEIPALKHAIFPKERFFGPKI